MAEGNFILSYLTDYSKCGNVLNFITCTNPASTIYFIITLINLVFYIFIGVKVLRNIKFSFTRIPTEFKYCIVITIRQIALYFKDNVFFYQPHQIYRTKIFSYNNINTSIYHLSNTLYLLELLRCLINLDFPLSNYIYWVGLVLMWINVVKLLLDSVLFCIPPNADHDILEKIVLILFQINKHEYYVIQGFSIIILSFIFVLSGTIQTMINAKYRTKMKVMVFLYCIAFIFNLVFVQIYSSKYPIKNILFNFPNTEYSYYIYLIVSWFAEQAVPFSQVIIVYALTIPNFGYKESVMSEELFSITQIV